MQKGEVQMRKNPVMHIAFVVTDLRTLLQKSNIAILFNPVQVKDYQWPVELLREEEVDHDRPAGEDGEDRDEEAENSLPGNPECLKWTWGWSHGIFLDKKRWNDRENLHGFVHEI